MKSNKSIKIIAIIFGILGITWFSTWLYLRYSPYPQIEYLQKQEYSIRVYDRNNNLIQITSVKDGLRREYTPLEKIPEEIQKTFILAEDKRFYFHHGVDYFAALNAFFQNSSSKKIIRGASTIPMQLSKISEPITEHNFKRKLKDVLNAYKIEARMSKKEILELYLNSVPFGMNSSGVTTAARSFFGKELNELTTEQIYCLAIIPRRPTFYNPIENPENCAEMAEYLAKHSKKNLTKSDNHFQNDFLQAAKSAFFYQYPFYMPHYITYLKQNNSFLPDDDYNLHLSCDLNLQNTAESFLRDALFQAKDSRIVNGALLVLDNTNGDILAWVGNANWFDTQNNGQIDGVLAKNQPGSSMKPFLYALAFDTTTESGDPLYYPSKIIPDIPQQFGTKNIYIPGNFNNKFNGPIRTRIALASSLNIPAVTILDEIGVETYLNKLIELGFDSLQKTGKSTDLGLALGAGEVSLYELVNAFSVFPRDGKDFSENQIYSVDTARLICSILSDKGARSLGFGYSQTFQTDYPSIFKTGTANQYQNITALGATKQFTIGVWMGNFKGQTVIGKTGSSLPAWVAKNVLDSIQKKVTAQQFEEPENWKKQKICSLSGMIATESCPATIYEYVKNNSELQNCTWHTHENDDIKVTYPAEYQQWARENNIPDTINYFSTKLELLTPKNDSIFYTTNNKSIEQAIPVEIIGGANNELLIYYDDFEPRQIKRPFSFKLPVEKGNHNCTFTCGEESISISFIVK